MSDLAPFVAAAIESKVVADLKEENDQLKEENDRLKDERDRALDSARWGGCVEITCEGGSPVYARGRMEEIVYNGVTKGSRDFFLAFQEPQLAKCPIGKAYSAEVRINGVKIANVGDYERYDNNGGLCGFYHFQCGCRTPWGDLDNLLVRIGHIPPHRSWPCEDLHRPAFPKDFRDEDKVEVTFETIAFTVPRANIQEGDIFSHHHFWDDASDDDE